MSENKSSGLGCFEVVIIVLVVLFLTGYWSVTPKAPPRMEPVPEEVQPEETARDPA